MAAKAKSVELKDIEATEVQESKVKKTTKKAPAKPKEDKYLKILEDVLIKLKKDPLTRREIINLIQQRLNEVK